MRCELMHKDVVVAVMTLTDRYCDIYRVNAVENKDHMPFGTVVNGYLLSDNLSDWWRSRSIPASRNGLRNLLESLGIESPSALLSRSMGLSLSDQYWIRPVGSDIEWKDVNFFDNSFSDDVGDLLFGHAVREGHIDLSSPDNTSDGVLKKRWKIVDGKRCLIKGAGSTGQEPYNEAIASDLMERQGIDHADYSIIEVDGKPCSICEDFIDRNTELVPASMVRSSMKRDNRSSFYSHYVSCCENLGLDIIPDLDRMLVVDYLMLNGDRHFGNFGLIRNADTLEWVGSAPIYDTGTSLSCEVQTQSFDAEQECESKPFARSFDDQLKLVTDTSWFDVQKMEETIAAARELLHGQELSAYGRDKMITDLLQNRLRNLVVAVGIR